MSKKLKNAQLHTAAVFIHLYVHVCTTSLFTCHVKCSIALCIVHYVCFLPMKHSHSPHCYVFNEVLRKNSMVLLDTMQWSRIYCCSISIVIVINKNDQFSFNPLIFNLKSITQLTIGITFEFQTFKKVHWHQIRISLQPEMCTKRATITRY